MQKKQRRPQQKSTKPSWFLERINAIDKPLDRLIKKQREKNEINKIQAEIRENEMTETIVKINKSKSWFFEKINKIDKTLARLIKKKKDESNQQN